MEPKNREKYRAKLLELRGRSRDELNRMIEVVRDDARAAGEHDREVSESVDKEVMLEQTEESIRSAVIAALQRIDDGTFGKCERCGQTIPAARLDALPFTSRCVRCEQESEVRSRR